MLICGCSISDRAKQITYLYQSIDLRPNIVFAYFHFTYQLDK